MMSYQTNEEKLASVYFTEKVDRKTGWQYICLEEEWTRGYLQEIQDSWNASRPAGSRSRIWRWPLRRSRSTTPAIGRRRGPRVTL